MVTDPHLKSVVEISELLSLMFIDFEECIALQLYKVAVSLFSMWKGI